MINEKDKSIKNLIQDLKNKEEKIISLNKDLISIKKDRDDKRAERLHREYADFFLLKPREISRWDR